MNVAGLSLEDEVIAPNVATALFSNLREGVTWNTQIATRRTASFGEPYVGSGLSYDYQPMHELLRPLMELCESRAGFVPTNCLLNLYPDGDSRMGFHSDATRNLAHNTGIAIFSLGSDRTMVLRRKSDRSIRSEVLLTNGSLLVMSVAMQRDWEHSIERTDAVGARISATFRHIV
jgi:alkylated DNA repair dioxygenase AlkB